MKVCATILAIGTGVGLAFGMIVASPGPGEDLLGGLLGFISTLYLAHLAER